jgi:hypothetical protein
MADPHGLAQPEFNLRAHTSAALARLRLAAFRLPPREAFGRGRSLRDRAAEMF